MNPLLEAVMDQDSEAVSRAAAQEPVWLNAEVDDLTPLMLACDLGDREVVRALLLCGADPDQAVGDEMQTALHAACHAGDLQIALLLLEHGARVDARTSEGMTPLMCAARGGSEAMVRALLARGADPGEIDHLSRSALHWAVAGGTDIPEVIAALLEARADPLKVSAFGDTPIDYAHKLGATRQLNEFRGRISDAP